MKVTAVSSRVSILAFCVAGALGLGVARAELIHRYSFTEPAAKGGDVKDLVGKVDGKLKGEATVADGKLVLANGDKTSDDATLSYLEFSASVLPKGDSVSLAIWFTAKETGNFARLINIGDKEGSEGRAFIYLTPRNADGSTRWAITATDAASKTAIDSDGLDDGKPHLAVLVIDGKAKKLRAFVDGKELAEAQDLGDNTLDKVKAVSSWIGRSAFDADTGLSGTVDEFRVYDTALTAAEVDAVFKAGADKLPAK